jgi:hypothetical protein
MRRGWARARLGAGAAGGAPVCGQASAAALVTGVLLAALPAGCGTKVIVTVEAAAGETVEPADTLRVDATQNGAQTQALTYAPRGDATSITLPTTLGLVVQDGARAPVTVCVRTVRGSGDAAAVGACGCGTADLHPGGRADVTVPLYAVRVPGTPAPAAPCLGARLAAGAPPTFAWTAAAPDVTGDCDDSYFEVEYAGDPAFPAAATTVAATTEASYVPLAALPVSSVPPVGARYWWHVRACVANVACSAWSATWHFDVGRGARDVDGDGFDDLVVGAPRYVDGVSGAEGVFRLFPGAASFSGTATIARVASAAPAQLGAALAFAGDVNGDLYADVLAGAPEMDGPVAFGGGAFLYLGPDLVAPAGALETGGVIEMHVGDAVAGAGDLNGDGFDDFAVGSAGTGFDGTLPGTVYVHLGEAGPGPYTTVMLTGLGPGDEFGAALAAGDLDADGYSDLIVGAPQAGAGDDGVVYVFRGGPGTTFDTTPDLTVDAPGQDGLFGAALASGGDLDADGYHDFVAGAPAEDGGAGEVHVYRGRAALDTMIAFNGGAGVAGEAFGAAVAIVGDADGDGYDDLVVGAPNNDAATTDAGRAYFFPGGPDLGQLAAVLPPLDGATLYGEMGLAVAAVGDLDGDGAPDFALGAPARTTMPTGASVRVYFGSTGVVDLQAAAGDDFFGFAIAH